MYRGLCWLSRFWLARWKQSIPSPTQARAPILQDFHMKILISLLSYTSTSQLHTSTHPHKLIFPHLPSSVFNPRNILSHRPGIYKGKATPYPRESKKNSISKVCESNAVEQMSHRMIDISLSLNNDVWTARLPSKIAFTDWHIATCVFSLLPHVFKWGLRSVMTHGPTLRNCQIEISYCKMLRDGPNVQSYECYSR